MGSLHLFTNPKPPYNFHNDESLHDGTTAEVKPWYSNLTGDAYAVIKNLPVYRKQGREQFAKYVASDLDLDDPLNKFISKKLVSMLWGSLIHPPVSYRSNEFRYRTADGSNNSVLYPNLGKAGLPYAKSVPTKRAMYGALPDPGDLFDLLMGREGAGRESESGISMMLLYHATTIIHDIFRTDDDDSNVSATSSYLDLAPLYGNNVEQQHSVRSMRDGLLKADTFAETRLLNQPPGVCIYIIMYNRFHNYVAKQLKEINEHGRFSLPPGVTEKDRSNPKHENAFKLQDEHLFQTARLITCGLYINIAIHDYLKCLMGVHTLDTPWTLDPRKPLPETDNRKGLSRGEGNMVSAEFNLLYRFHSPISRRDAEWSEDLFVLALGTAGYIDDTGNNDDPEATKAKNAKGKYTSKQVKNGEFPVSKFRDYLEIQKQRAKKRNTSGLFPEGLDLVGATGHDNLYRFKRDPKTGLFDDAQMAAELYRAIEDPICSFGAQQIPKVFRSIEIMGILQARKWEIATLNEYREFFGMSRFKSFEEINSDPDIQNKLRNLYEDPDLVEFYPGVFAEGQGRNLDPGTPMPQGAASSLWRGVFSDAVTLVRSDRFYTLDWNVGSLTAWGMNEVTSDPKVNKGSVMHRLFQRALPGCFEYNSVHLWQPFYTPTANIALAKEQGYLKFLDLTGLEDKNGKPHVFIQADNETLYSTGNQKVRFNKWNDMIKTNLVRRKLEFYDWAPPGSMGRKWRGAEYVKIKPQPVEITSYKAIREQILGGPNSSDWVSQVMLEPKDIPSEPLMKIMTKDWKSMKTAVGIANKSLPKNWEQVFLDYFVQLSQDIRIREERKLQKTDTQVYQLDIVKDLAIPVVTRFIADFLGFWNDIKTPECPNRKYNENEIYNHIENCQNFEAYNSDPTKAWHRRQEFRASIKVLIDLAEEGVGKYSRGWFEGILWRRNNGSSSDGQYVKDLRQIGVDMTQALLRTFRPAEVAAILLHTALDAAQRFVLTFTEIVAWFIDPTRRADKCCVDDEDEQTKQWIKLKTIAWQDTVESGSDTIKPKGQKFDLNTTHELEQYILEASRISNPLDIVRVYQPDQGVTSTQIVVNPGEPKQTVRAGETVLLNLRAAYSDKASGIGNPEDFKLRSLDTYIGYGPTVSAKAGEMDPPRFSKRVAVIALTGLVKHCAHLSGLRVAHDKAGRLKRVHTPEGFDRYASVKWDRLVAFPTTWNVRYDGVGTETYTAGDNADQGHGQNMIWQYESLIDQVDASVTHEKKQEAAEKKALQQQIDAAVKKAVAEALAKAKVDNDVTTKRPQFYSTEIAADTA